MNVIFLGPPGAGKGTQGEQFAKQFSLVTISTGHILRAAVKAQTPLGRQVQDIMASGQLVSEDIIIEMMKARLAEPDCEQGFILDGFPRSEEQAIWLREAGVNIDFVFELVVSDETVLRRLTGRLVHPASGRTYHREFSPPAESGLDDLTGEPLVQRPDDQPETVKDRLHVYHEQTAPVVAFYKQWMSETDLSPHFVAISADDTPDMVAKALISAVEAYSSP